MDLNIKILIVDDITMMRRILRYTLKQIGLTNIIEADDGKSAIKALKREKVDIILCDWNMPKMKGIDVLNKVRSDNELKAIPFIMVTVKDNKKDIEGALKSGVTDYILKPFTAKTFSKKLEKILDG